MYSSFQYYMEKLVTLGNTLKRLPLISIVMSIYKEPIEWIELSINSVLVQSYPVFELILVDDNPHDAALSRYLNELAARDNRIRVLFNEENIGLTRSLNRACQIIKGDYLARIDADDIWKERKLQTQVSYMESHPRVDVCGTWIELIDENGGKCGRYVYPVRHIDIIKQMIFSNPIVHSSVLARASILKERIPSVYNEKCRTSQDYDLWTSLYMMGACFANIPQYLTYYRYSSQQISKVKQGEQRKTAQGIADSFTSNIFEKVAIDDYKSLSCRDLSRKLKSCHINSTYSPLLYHYLWKCYSNSYCSKKELLIDLLRSGDFLRFPVKDTAKLILGRF